jgi:hypothetical protein
MFTDAGVWKEFGIGRNPATYTWMPFWLFCILWALFSYLLCVLLADSGILPGLWVSHVEVEAPVPSASKPSRGPKASSTATPGYYMLNTEGSGISGVPKYIYIGPAAPGASQE